MRHCLGRQWAGVLLLGSDSEDNGLGVLLFCHLTLCVHVFLSLQPASKEPVSVLLEKARAVMPAKPAPPPGKAGAAKSSSGGAPASKSGWLASPLLSE